MKRRLRTIDEVMEFCKKNFQEMPFDAAIPAKRLADEIDKKILEKFFGSEDEKF